jgi:uncharacterized protein YggE
VGGAALAGLLATAGAWFGPAAARAAEPGPATRATTVAEATGAPGTVTGVGVARVRGTPDTLTLELGVTSRAKSAGEALSQNSASAQKVISILVEAGIDKKDIQTSNFSITPVTDERGATVIGYSVDNLLTVTLRDLGRAGTLIDRATEVAGDDVVVRGLAFSIDDDSDLVATARQEAVKRARSQAEQLAGAAGVGLGSVVDIHESSPSVGPVLEHGAAASAAAPIEPGSEILTVEVTIVFSLR